MRRAARLRYLSCAQGDDQNPKAESFISMQELLANMTFNPGAHARERRRHPRIDEALPVKVSGVDEDGQTFEAATVIDNISAGGLYMRLARCLAPGTQLFVTVRFTADPSSEAPPLRLFATGEILRAAMLPDGTCGVALMFTSSEIL